MAENTTYSTIRTTTNDGAEVRTVRLVYDATAITSGDYTEIDVGFRAKSIVVENLTTNIRWEWNDAYAVDHTATGFTVGARYKIKSVGTTDFTLVGAVNNVIGTEFTATGVGAGNGVATTSDNTSTKITAPGVRTFIGTNGFFITDRTVQISQLSTAPAVITATSNVAVVITG